MFAIVQLFVAFALCATNVIAKCDVEKPVPALNRTDDTPAGILKLLHEGERLVELDAEDRDMVVFLGITGSGKTTFVLHIGGNDEDLTSTPTRPRSREYIIADRCNRSSTGAKTLESHTLIPDRFLDTHTKMTYFDMPGFSDTRPRVAYDIAATYFTKLVLDYAKRIKLVFVVNYSHVKVGEDRGRFPELVQHITTLIRDLSKFQDSIALIVTKVDNVQSFEASADEPYVTDQEVAEGIAEFLTDAKSFYLNDNRAKAAQLMDIFLHRKNGSLDRIGVFRRPDQPGPLINVTTLQRSKHRMRTIIDTNIRFAEKDKSDFGYTLSEKSRNILHKLRAEVVKNSTESIRALGNHIRDHFYSRERSAADLLEMTSIFNASYIDVTTYRTINDFLDYMTNFVRQIGLSITGTEDMRVLRENEKHMDFLNGISGDAAIDWSSGIQNGIGATIEYLHHSQAWYVLFLNNVYDIFSRYDMQRVRSKIEPHAARLFEKIEKLENLPEINLVQLDDAMIHFLKEVGDEPLTRAYNSLGPIYLNKQKLHLLKKILNATFKYEVEISCEPENNKLIIRGRYLILSQIVDKIDNCSAAHFIRILALERIFLDTNFNLTGKEVDLFMIASTWIAIGQVEITLNGNNGKHYETSARGGIVSAAQYIRNGKHGSPGMPGGPAGHFYGMARDFVNDKQLTISAVGGNGGDGQRGGDGSTGERYTAPEPYEGSDTYLSGRYPQHTIKTTLVKKSSGFWHGVGYFIGAVPYEEVYRIEIKSPPPSAGGSGGNGGRGGIGGWHGNVTLVNFKTGGKFAAKIISQNGKDGIAGRAGKGAAGGESANVLVESLTKESYWWSNVFNNLIPVGYSASDLSKAQDGSDGASGVNDDGIELPRSFISRDFHSDINGYKAFARANLPYDVRKDIQNTLYSL